MYAGIRAILLADNRKPGGCSVWTFDSRSLAMEVNQAAYSQKLDRVTSSDFNPIIFFVISGQEYSLMNKLEKKPMYFDKEGYVYTQNGRRWIKTPFVLVKAMTRKLLGLAEGMFSFLELPHEQPDYYGIDVQPDKYPILEWAFKYKVYHFEAVEELEKEFVNINGDVFFKYTATSGKDKGSFVLFDHLGRLVEIYTINSGRILYTYGDYTVKLPEAQLVGQF